MCQARTPDLLFETQRIFLGVGKINKKNIKYVLAILALLLLPFIISFFIKTDEERIEGVIKAGEKAIEKRDAYGLEHLISSDYYGEYASTKIDLLTLALEHFKYIDSIKIDVEKVEINLDVDPVEVKCYCKILGFYNLDNIYKKVPFRNEGYLADEPDEILLNFKKDEDGKWRVVYFKGLEVLR